MSRLNSFFRTTLGAAVDVIVAKPVAYPLAATYPTYADFVQNGIDGQVGIFTSIGAANVRSENTYVPLDNSVATNFWGGTTGISALANTKFFIAQVQVVNGQRIVKKLPTIDAASVTGRNNYLFQRPVRQVRTVGFNGTAGSTDGNPVLTTESELSLTVIDNSTPENPFLEYNYSYTPKFGETMPIAMSKLVNIVNLSTNANNRTYYPNIVKAKLKLNGTKTGGTVTVTSGNIVFTKGSTLVTATGHNITVGSFITVGVAGTNGNITTAPGASSDCYLVTDVSTNTFVLNTPYVGVVEQTAVTTETVPNANVATAITTVTSIVAGGTGIELTSTDFGRFFSTATNYSVLTNATVRDIANFIEGIGDPDTVYFIEREGNILKGWSTLNAAYSKQFGEPNQYTSYSNCYNVIQLDFKSTQESKALPGAQDSNLRTVLIFTPATTASIAVSPAQTLISGTTVDGTTAASTHHRNIHGVLVATAQSTQ